METIEDIKTKVNLLARKAAQEMNWKIIAEINKITKNCSKILSISLEIDKIAQEIEEEDEETEEYLALFKEIDKITEEIEEDMEEQVYNASYEFFYEYTSLVVYLNVCDALIDEDFIELQEDGTKKICEADDASIEELISKIAYSTVNIPGFFEDKEIKVMQYVGLMFDKFTNEYRLAYSDQFFWGGFETLTEEEKTILKEALFLLDCNEIGFQKFMKNNLNSASDLFTVNQSFGFVKRCSLNFGCIHLSKFAK